MTINRLFDAIIIGAGSIGCPTALALSNAGLHILVIDQFPSVGQGSNKMAIGGIRATHSDAAKIQLCQRSLDVFSTWKEIYGDEIEWIRGGYCFVAYQEAECEKLQELLFVQKSFNLNIDWLSNHELLSIIPDLNPKGLLGGTYAPDDGSASPLLAIHAMYQRSKLLKAEYQFSTQVTDLLTADEQILGVETNQGNYYSPIIINTTGAWAGTFGNKVSDDLPVRPDSHESGVTEPVERFFFPMIVDIAPHSGSANIYFYQHHTGQVFFCMTPHPNHWGFDCEETSSFLPMVSKRLITLMPRLRNIRVRRTWRGLYPMTPDGAPLIGWSNKYDGLFHAVGMCGQGFMLGPGVGELIARTVIRLPIQGDNEILRTLSPYRSYLSQEVLK